MAAGTYSTILAAGGNTGRLFSRSSIEFQQHRSRAASEKTFSAVKEYVDECPFPTLA